jgi:hypothetical protein
MLGVLCSGRAQFSSLAKSINLDFRFTHPGVPGRIIAANTTRELKLVQSLLESQQ